MCITLVNFIQGIRPYLEVIAIVATLVMAFIALLTYDRSVKLDKTKWMKELYEKFYEQPQLKCVREQLDSGDGQKISELVKEESAPFTDYLNFFEFLAYLEKSKQVSRADTLGLFRYYLQNLQANREVMVYVQNPSNGFEGLREMLKRNLDE